MMELDGLRLNMTIHPYCGRFGLATVSLRVHDLLNYTTIDPMVQRKLSGGQRRKITNYLQERELDHVFFGPVTLSLRDVSLLAKADGHLVLQHGSKLSILDGQHRILALGYTNEQLLKEARKYEREAARLKLKVRRYPEETHLQEELEQTEGLLAQVESRRLDLLETELSVQLYVGLGEEEEKQLFGDINSKVQLVSKELGHSFDGSDPLNIVLQQVADHNELLKTVGIERRNNLTAYNKNFTCFSWMYSIASLLYTGKMNPSYELARRIRRDMTSHVELMHQFFNAVLPHMPEQPGTAQYISSSRVIQESIALYAHDYLYAGGKYNTDWASCLEVLSQIDWTHDNPELIERFGQLDNGKLNLVHEKSMRKHANVVEYLKELGGRLESPAV
ncbi:DNA sulfur modification protein DndB [Paenibacillus humicola]|uniref:DNA sulfur modification protein DndB n=1 Tax=Paenibacillus humicola TaxID=3110540 RepID=UPI00237A8B2B|nr:DNA sulfur modification protein DndB [Paenibacillus humicola]